MKLTPQELGNPGVMRIMEHYAIVLQKLREKNDQDQDDKKTAVLRGRIQEIKAILKIGNPEPDVVITPGVNFSDG